MIGDAKPKEEDEIEITEAMANFTPFGKKAKKKNKMPNFEELEVENI